MKIIVDELPNSCDQCIFGDGGIRLKVSLDRITNKYEDSCNCRLTHDIGYGFNLKENRLSKCPLKTIKNYIN